MRPLEHCRTCGQPKDLCQRWGGGHADPVKPKKARPGHPEELTLGGLDVEFRSEGERRRAFLAGFDPEGAIEFADRFEQEHGRRPAALFPQKGVVTQEVRDYYREKYRSED